MKGVPIITVFERPSIRHLVKLILYENEIKLLRFKGSPVQVDLWYVEVWDFDYWYLKGIHQEKQ